MSGKYNKRPAEEDLLASNTSKRSRIASGEGYRKGSDVCQVFTYLISLPIVTSNEVDC
jgi:hypothetical protein